MLRISEAVAINVSNINATTKTFSVDKSKTDQSGKGSDQFIAESTQSAIIEYQKALISAYRRELEKDDPVFVSFFKGGRPKARLSIRGAREIVTREFHWVKGASGHSFRVGACTDMGINDITLPMIMKSGRWKSPHMPALYLRSIDAKNSGMAKLARMQNR